MIQSIEHQGLSYQLLMSSRAYKENSIKLMLVLPPSYEPLLTQLIRKNIIEQIKTLPLGIQEVGFVFQYVDDSPEELANRYAKQLAQEQEEKDCQQPLVKWLLTNDRYFRKQG